MASFSDLPFELQTEIFRLVLPPRGGVHWVELEGLPQPLDIITETLRTARDQFNDLEPGLYKVPRYSSVEYDQHCALKYEDGDHSTPFFEYLYPIVPSVWGQSKEPVQVGWEDKLAPEIVEEILETRRCRQLSTYTQVTTLLSTCRSSRLTALEYIHKMIPNIAASLYRGIGPLSRPRPLSTWQQQYKDPEKSPQVIAVGNALVPTICTTLDLVVLRLHTSSGYPTLTLKHAYWQLKPEASIFYQRFSTIPVFPRIGIEYRPLWTTIEGRKEFCEDAITAIIGLAGRRSQLSTQLYWLIDGIPRPQWDQYHPAIPAAFNRVIERARSRIFKNCKIRKDKKKKAQLLEHHNLHQEFEANGRRYYVVFVVATWRSEYYIEESYLNPAVDWDGIFPGGEDIWPVPLRDPVRLAFDLEGDLSTDTFCTTLLSWEPI